MGNWRSGYLTYNNVPLSTVIADANRYAQLDIVIIDKAVGELTVTASFNSAEIKKMIDSLAVVLPIQVESTPYDAIVIKGER